MCRYWIQDEYNGDGDCELDTSLECDYCKFGSGNKNPFAKKYQRTNANTKQQVQPEGADKTLAC